MSKTSEIWRHFNQINDNNAKCSYCSSVYSYKGGSTSNLNRHLKRKHSIQYECASQKRQSILIGNYENVDDPTSSQPSTSLDQPSTSLDQPSTSQIQSSSSSNNIIKHPPPPSLIKTFLPPKQTRIESFITKPVSVLKSKQIDEQLAIMIAKEFQPYSIVEDTEFKQFVNILNPGYTLPSRKTISNSIIPQLYATTKEKVSTNLKNALYIAITTDGWTSINTNSFIAVTGHFIDRESCELKSHILGCYNFEDRHTSVNLSTFLNKTFEDWNIAEKVKVAVSDNAANITAAINMNSWSHIPCFAHSLNLVAQSGLNEISDVHKKVKSIVEHFKKSTLATSKLKNMQIQMGHSIIKLKQDVTTRWNSTYDMFKRILETKEPLLCTIAVIPKISSLSTEDFEVMEHYCTILKPFKDITIELSSENAVSISKIMILSRSLLIHLKKKSLELQTPKVIQSMIKVMDQKAQKRFDESLEENSVLAEATFLDPRFKKKGFGKDVYYQRAYQKLVSRTAGIISKNKKTDLLAETGVNSDPDENTGTHDENDIWETFDNEVRRLKIHICYKIKFFSLKLYFVDLNNNNSEHSNSRSYKRNYKILK